MSYDGWLAVVNPKSRSKGGLAVEPDEALPEAQDETTVDFIVFT